MKLKINTYLFSLYFLSNLCYTQKYQNYEVTEIKELTNHINLVNSEHTSYISSFGEDLNGELYMVDYSGDIYKIGFK